jgi:hypothetical protein
MALALFDTSRLMRQSLRRCCAKFSSATKRKELRCRPTLDDVDRLARGQRANRRGIGSRLVPHRLNWDEREAYETAIRRGFAVVRGSGNRRERKGSPLLNTLRQRADALARPLVWVERVRGKAARTCVDVSPLRCARSAAACLERAYATVDLAATEVEIGAARIDVDAAALSDQLAHHPQTDEERESLPIWALEACIARFEHERLSESATGAADRDAIAQPSPEKRSKRLAQRLADALL